MALMLRVMEATDVVYIMGSGISGGRFVDVANLVTKPLSQDDDLVARLDVSTVV